MCLHGPRKIPMQKSGDRVAPFSSQGTSKSKWGYMISRFLFRIFPRICPVAFQWPVILVRDMSSATSSRIVGLGCFAHRKCRLDALARTKHSAHHTIRRSARLRQEATGKPDIHKKAGFSCMFDPCPAHMFDNLSIYLCVSCIFRWQILTFPTRSSYFYAHPTRSILYSVSCSMIFGQIFLEVFGQTFWPGFGPDVWWEFFGPENKYSAQFYRDREQLSIVTIRNPNSSRLCFRMSRNRLFIE